MLGTDVGFGWGWKMLAGSLTPVYSDWYTIHHFNYTDSTGAEYELDTVSAGIWRSRSGIFVEYDAVAKRLYFPGGTFWEFDCTANGTEADAGTMYPTRLVDTNGNEVKLRYQGGLFYGGTNGSARVTAVEDVRAVAVGSGYRTYSFTYNADAIPHLTGIASDIGDGASFGFSYSSGHTLNDPFVGASFGMATRLHTMTVTGGGGLQFSMEYNSGSHELKKVTMPYGGTLEWVYGAKTLAGSRTQMEVTSRILNAADGQGNKTYAFHHNDTVDVNLPAHYYTGVVDASLAADKVYYFHTAADYRLGTFWGLYERGAVGGGPVEVMRSSVATWALTANGNPYISSSEEVINPGLSGVEKASKTEQVLNDYGNLTERKQYGYYTPGGSAPLVRTFSYSYLGSSAYASRRIWNRLLSVKVQKPGGSLITLVTNSYDIYPYGDAPQVAFPALLRQHDTAAYGTAMIYRGNVSTVTSSGKILNLTYDYTGNLLATADGYGHSASRVMDWNRNYSVPQTVTGGSLQTALSWNSYNAPLSATGPNGDVSLTSYDGYARPATRTEANGSVTTFTYSATAPHWTRAVTGTRWTKSWVDGFGRGIKVEAGYNTGSTPTTVSIAETKYAPCACTPVGKLWKTSLPYAPGGTPIWTEYFYDALGRTVQVKLPPLSGTTSAGITTYTYSGVEVTVTDAAGKWKKSESDALGNLIKVTEPGVGNDPPYVTTYTYSELGQLLMVTMARPGMGAGNGATVTQTRSWVYDANQRLTSVTHPESGTATYLYNADGSVLRKTDAKGQKVEFSYDGDGRLTERRRYHSSGQEEHCGRVNYYYGSQGFDGAFTQYAAGRLAATATGLGCGWSGVGGVIEMYSYTVAGAVAKKRLRIVRGNGTVDKDVSYGYSGGKLASVLYPGAAVPYAYSYDLMDRPVKMTGPSASAPPGLTFDHARDVAYGVAGQVTSMTYLIGVHEEMTFQGQEFVVPDYLQETKTYNALYQMTRQTAAGGSTVVDIEYQFSATANNGRITGRKNNISGQNVGYTYDALNRLASAANTGAGAWAQTFKYDGFGNLREQDATVGVAPDVLLDVNMSNNRMSSTGWLYDNNGNTISMPVVGGGTATMGYDADNRLRTWAGAAGTEEYAYLPDNKRVWKQAASGDETVYFYGADGQKLVTYAVQASPFVLVEQSVNVSFAGKAIRADGDVVVRDRLGSVVWRETGSKDYFPYGDQIGAATAGNVDKFGTYHRDQTTGLDYADQRYFTGLSGRFLSSDPYEASGGASNPGSWGRYAYVGGDPVNRTDQTGLYWDDCSMYGCLMAPPEDGGRIIWGGRGGSGSICNFNSWLPVPMCIGIPGVVLAPAPPPRRVRPKFLRVTDDCYRVPENGAVTREIMYELFDDSTPSTRYFNATITETITGDIPMTGPTMSGSPNGRFEDMQSVVGVIGTKPIQQLNQTFTADAHDDSEGPISVFVVGFDGEWGTLGITKWRDFVKINGNYGGTFDSKGNFKPKKICD